MDEIVSVMKDLGFSDYEARAYTALLQRNPVNGYELARLSEVPRGNIYAVLERLEERSAVARVDTAEGARYAPVPPHELLRRLSDRYQRSADAAERLLSQVAAPEAPSAVWNMGGYAALLEHAHSLIDSAEKELLLAVWPEEAKALAGPVSASAERGVSVRTLCLAGCPQECGACRGHIHRYQMQAGGASRWLLSVADAEEVLAGEIRPAGSGERDPAATRAIRTRQKLLVDLIASYMRHSVALAAVLTDAGDHLSPLLSADTLEALRAVSRQDEVEGWIGHLRHLLTAAEPVPVTNPGGDV